MAPCQGTSCWQCSTQNGNVQELIETNHGPKPPDVPVSICLAGGSGRTKIDRKVYGTVQACIGKRHFNAHERPQHEPHASRVEQDVDPQDCHILGLVLSHFKRREKITLPNEVVEPVTEEYVVENHDVWWIHQDLNLGWGC